MKKTAALITALCLLSGSLYEPAYAYAYAANADGNSFSVPASLGKVTGGKYFASPEIIINIQDLHCNGEVQRNIAKIIEDLDKKCGLEEVYLEGAWGEADTGPLAELMKEARGRETVEAMVDLGYLNATEYYCALSGKKNFIKGIEKEELYNRNLKLLGDIISFEKEVAAVCDELADDLGLIKKDYAGRDAVRLDKWIKRFQKGRLSAARYYSMLAGQAKKRGVKIRKYANISRYTDFIKKAERVDNEKVRKELSIFISELKERMPYGEFSRLYENSSAFSDIENIAGELSEAARKYSIFENGGYKHLKNFFTYLDFNGSVNPVEFAKEEARLTDELYSVMGSGEYGREVIFLSKFIALIRGYFTAGISAEELEEFESRFASFRSVWCSYFPENKVKKLDKYAGLLKEYHANNLKRDKIFAGIVMPAKDGARRALALEGKAALDGIGREIGSKKVKVVVTGGFHSKGLEKIFNENKISYATVTPNIAGDVRESEQIYKSIISGYKKIAESTLSNKALMKEDLTEALPKLIAASFVGMGRKGLFSEENLMAVIETFASGRRAGETELEKIEILKHSKKQLRFSVVFRNKKDKKTTDKRIYLVSGGKLKDITGISSGRTIKFEALSAFNSRIMENIASPSAINYGFVTRYIVPVFEEFVFRFLPFFAIAEFAPDSSGFILTVLSAAASASVFTLAHGFAGKAAIKSNLSAKKRKTGIIFVMSAVISAVYAAAYVFAPHFFSALFSVDIPSAAAHAAGYSAAVAVHMANNILALKKAEKLPALSIFEINGSVVAEKTEEKYPELLKKLNEVNIGMLEPQYHEKFNMIFEKIKEAETKSPSEKQELLSSALEQMTEFALSLEGIGYPLISRRTLILSAIADISPYVYSAETGGSMLEYIFERAFEKASGNPAEPNRAFNEILFSLSAQAYKTDKSAGIDMLKRLYEEKQYFSRSGIAWVKSSIAAPFYKTNPSYRPEIKTYKQARALIMPKEWTDASIYIDDNELLSFAADVMGVDFAQYGFTRRLALREKNKKVSSYEIARKLPSMISGLKKAAADNKDAYDLLGEERKKRFETILESLEKASGPDDGNRSAETARQAVLLFELAKESASGYGGRHDFLFGVFSSMLEIGGYIYTEDTVSLLEEIFDFTVKLAEKYPGGSEAALLLSELSAQGYSIDKELGMKMLKELLRPRNVHGRSMPVRIIEMEKTITSLRQIKEFLPVGWQHCISEDDMEKFYNELGVSFSIPGYEPSSYSQLSYTADFIKILKAFPPQVLSSLNKKVFEPLKIKIARGAEKGSRQSREFSEGFDAFSDLLENNMLALDALNSGSAKAVTDAVVFVEAMLKNLYKIDKALAVKALASLDNIKLELNGRLTSELIEKHKDLKPWTQKNIGDVRELHTLINALHQSAIQSFLGKITESGGKNTAGNYEGVRKIVLDPETEVITAYDFSDSETVNPQAIEFLAALSDMKYKMRFVMKDSMIIWSKKLRAHSIDIFVDLNDLSQGIRFSYTDKEADDQGEKIGLINRRKISFEKDFREAGLQTKVMRDGDTYRIVAFAGASGKSSAPREYAELFLKIFDSVERNAPVFRKESDSDWNDNREPDGIRGRYEKGASYEKRNPEPWQIKKIEKTAGIGSGSGNYAGLERLFANGTIKKGRDGVIRVDPDYKPMRKIIEAVEDNEDESFRNAQILNILDYDSLNLNSDGYIGEMISVNGFIKVSGGYISVFGAVDGERRRLKCAVTEFVDFDGGRRTLDYDELMSVLRREGFNVKRQLARSVQEKNMMLEAFYKEVPRLKESREIRGTGISSGPGGYISGVVTYDKNNVRGDSILFAGYTTPDDVSLIQTSRALVTTGGGALSHANITAREKGKTAVVIKEKWQGGIINAVVFAKSSEQSEYNGYKLREIKEENVLLREGERILVNGENGNILVFDALSGEKLERIQTALDGSDIGALSDIINSASRAQLGQIMEFIYFQSAGNEKYWQVTDYLKTLEKDGAAGRKLMELTNLYIGESLKNIAAGSANIDSIADACISYTLALKLEKRANFLYSAAPNMKEVSQMRAVIKEKRERQRRKFYIFVKKYKKAVNKILSLRDFNDEDLEKAVNLKETAAAWHNFYNYPGVEELVSLLERRIKDAAGANAAHMKGFEEMTAADVNEFGSKTAELAKIAKFVKRYGYNDVNIFVPYGIGIGKGFIEALFLHPGDLDEYNKYGEMFEKAVAGKDKAAAHEAARALSGLIEKADAGKAKEIMEKRLKPASRYAVRSSGVGEDGAAFSFAGMGESALNVPVSEIYEHIIKTWVSFYGDRSVDYMLESGQIVKPAILVQEMAENVEKAGVIFTRNENGNITMEFVLGLGEGLVSGRVEPDHIDVHVDTGRIEYTRAIGNIRKLVGIAEGGTKMVKLEKDEKIARILGEDAINQLAGLVLDLEKDSGYPVDVEIAIDAKGRIFILQRRAITTFPSDIAKAVRHNISFETDENAGKAEEILVNIKDPYSDEPVTLYYRRTKGDITVLSVKPRYEELLRSGKLAELLFERINSDDVVLNRLNNKLGISAAVDRGEVNILPYEEKFEIDDVNDARVRGTAPLSGLLSAA